MKFFIIFSIFIVIGVGVFVLPLQILAQDPITQVINDLPPEFGKNLTVQWLVNFLTNFICYFIRFAIISLVGMIIIYGILFLKSRGSPQSMMSSRKALLWGIVGGVVIFGVFTIVLSVANLIGVDYPILKMFNC